MGQRRDREQVLEVGGTTSRASASSVRSRTAGGTDSVSPKSTRGGRPRIVANERSAVAVRCPAGNADSASATPAGVRGTVTTSVSFWIPVLKPIDTAVDSGNRTWKRS
ncbi:hypothetical protein ACFQRB_11160 [Halobaculum litoreum]|uniref:Uncharacterized protein n=1 Tax=Halobaculum litoreum TaxID=3031998 RepID=A0ABD5XTR1_9EURY